MLAVPRCMSTQHPDNATVPFFAASSVLAGEDLRLTLRVPNPAVEGTEANVLLETLESIPPRAVSIRWACRRS